MKNKIKILIIDDLKEYASELEENLRLHGFSAEYVTNVEKGLVLLSKDTYDVVLLDNYIPGMSGLEALPKIKEISQTSQVIMITGHGSYQDAVKAMKIGAYDYVIKPFMLKELIFLIEKSYRESHSFGNDNFFEIISDKNVEQKRYFGKTKKVAEILKIINQIAPYDSTVLITGETGTGKELVAKEIFEKSKRCDKPFVVLNCSALQESLIESELFGHEQGAFTGAVREKRGLVEIADGGTLFLDEIGELSPGLQAKLLRLLEQGEYRRVGGTKEHKTNVRIIAATNRNLEEEVKNGIFRKDLYYRLNVINITPPPLRERREDIPYMICSIISFFNNLLGRKVTKVSNEVIDLFLNYEWPGNVRELENIIENTMLTSKGEIIRKKDLPSKFLEFEKKVVKKSNKPLSDIEKEYILSVLKENKGNKLKSARTLGIDRTTLYNKLREYGIKD